MEKLVKIGKKGGAKRVATEISNIRKTPISNEIYEIIKNYNKNHRKIPNRSAKSFSDFGV